MRSPTRRCSSARRRRTTATPRDWQGAERDPRDAARLAALYDLDHAPQEGGPDVEWFSGLARRTGGPILELGCGTGRIAVPIAQDGHHVVGLDRSAAMLERADRRARRANVDVRWVEGDMRAFSFDEAFALIFVAFNSFLMLSPDDRWACLARVREHLGERGRVAIDVFQPDPEVVVGLDGGVVDEWERTDPETSRIIRKFSSSRADVDGVTQRIWYDESADDGTVRRITGTATLHYLYRREAELLFSEAGFHIETLHGDYDGNPAGPTSRKLLVVAKRKERGTGRERRRT
ncbi:MAG TPA: methyltransferase domain-containing protein [Candidatus Limnocylindria bacterium]|jgi:SAM-dependent methyltransferase|nr:methyltransferase domain-containing protein [Candidatus Limnocylindria bacterium]